MWHQINRLIEKYTVLEDSDDQVAIDLVNILKGHRDELGVDTPADPLSYEELMSYHLAFPPFFPNQKPFTSDDDFFVNTHEKYANPDASNIENIIERRRAWFEEEMEKKRERKVDIKYFDANNWESLPAGGLDSLTPYGVGRTASINYKYEKGDSGEFAKSGRTDNVAALFQGYVYVDQVVTQICVTSDDGSKLFLDDVLAIDNGGNYNSRMVCADISSGVHKLDVEYFNGRGEKELILLWGDASGSTRVVPPRSFATVREKALMPQILSWSPFLLHFI